MNSSQLRGDLPEPVRRYFLEVAQMQPPADLLDTAVAEIERTPRVNRFAALPVFGALAAAAVVIALVVFSLLPGSGPNVGGDATPPPSAPASAAASAAASASPSPSIVPIATLSPIESLPSAGTIAATYEVGSAGVPVLSAHGSVWLANIETGTLTRMDPATGELGAAVVVNANPDTNRYDLNAVADDRWVWATGTDETVVKIDPETNAVVERIDIGTMVYRMVLHDGQLWLTDLDQGGHVMRVDTATNEIVADVNYPFWPAALAVTDTDVWMAPYQDNRLHRIDPETGTSVETIQVWTNSMQILALGDSLYITGNQERPVERVDLTEGAVVARVPEMGVAIAGSRLYGMRYDGAFMELDPETLQPRSALLIDGGETGIGLYADGRFYAYQGGADPRIVVIEPAD